jgi:hypothetical protein
MKPNKGSFHKGRSKFAYFLIFYLILTVCLYIFVFANRTVYDDWVLDGVFIPVAVFVVISVVAMTLLHNNKKLVLVAGIFLGSMNIIPGLKYSSFYNLFDGPGHYRFAEQIALLGHIPQNEFYSSTYGTNPATHIFAASLSIISGISVNDVLKFFIPVLFGLIPFIIYLIGHNILDDNTLKYTIIASILPVIQAYAIWGTVLAFIPYLLLVSVFILFTLPKGHSRIFFLLFAVLGFAVVTSHAVTSLFVSMLFLGVFLIPPFYGNLRKKPSSLNVRKYRLVVAVFLILLWGWWSTVSAVNLDYLVSILRTLINPSIPVIPTRFFQLSIIPQLQIFIVLNMANSVVAALSVLGLLVFIDQTRKGKIFNETKRLYIMVTVLVLIVSFFVVVQGIANFGLFSYQRLLIYGFPWCFFLMGLILSRINFSLRRVTPIARTALLSSLLVVLVFLCLIQVYPYQPLVPRANVLSTTLPSNDYIVDQNLVNTVYQRYMISFAANHSKAGPIVADTVSRDQSYGFSDPSFFSRIEYPSPLYPANQNMPWHLYLLHTSKAGPFGEKVEYRTDNIIQNVRNNAGDVVYDNGASFIISNPTQNNVP